jgi:uncharacterized membrane protein YgdD (TMEM256/DUF423 family)
MNTLARRCILWGALFGLSGVMIGAFGAHGLKALLTADQLAIYHTGVDYQFVHALALLLLGALAQHQTPKAWQLAATLFIAGVFIFSGSLYLLVLTDTSWLGAITPIGGTSFIAGWAALLWGLRRG